MAGRAFGLFLEPADYKGQEPSNLVFSEFRRALRTAKLFIIAKFVNFASLAFAFFALWHEKITNLLRYVINKCYICIRF